MASLGHSFCLQCLSISNSPIFPWLQEPSSILADGMAKPKCAIYTYLLVPSVRILYVSVFLQTERGTDAFRPSSNFEGRWWWYYEYEGFTCSGVAQNEGIQLAIKRAEERGQDGLFLTWQQCPPVMPRGQSWDSLRYWGGKGGAGGGGGGGMPFWRALDSS